MEEKESLLKKLTEGEKSEENSEEHLIRYIQ